MAAKKKTAKPISSFDDLDAAGIGVGYQPFVQESGEQDAAPSRVERTWGQAVGDTAVQLAEGVNTTLGAVPSIVAPDGAMAGLFRDNADYWRDKQSEVLKQRIAATDQRIQEAGKEGVLSQIGTAASEYWNDPAQAARLVATNLPSMAATLGTGALAGATAKGVAAARGLDAANKAALAAQYGTRTAMATNAALNAGGARGEAYEDLKRAALAQGMSPEQAEQAALDGSVLPGVVGGVAGAVSGKLGLEKALLGQPGAGTGTALRRSAGAFGAELAGEQIEEVAPKITTNYEAGKIDPARSLTDDLGRTMVETTIGAGPGALVAGGVEGMNTPAQAAADAIRATETVPESGPMTRASNAATEAKAQAIEAGAPLVDEQATAEPTPEPVDDPVRDQILALPDGARQDALRAYAVVNRTDVAKGVQQYNRKLLDRLLTENAPPPVLGESLTGTDMGTMLGGGGMAGRADPLAGALGMGREAQANSITNVANVAERRPPMPASDAARMLDEARNRGLDLAVAEHPAGGFVLVPQNWVTPDMAAQGEARLNETIARMQQADAAPVERAPRTRTDGVGLNLQTDPVQNYMDTLRTVNTPAAQAYVRDFDAGRITPADVQQRMTAEQSKTPDQLIAQAAAEAPAKTDPVADRLARAAAQGMASPAPTDILNPSGLPFKTMMAANLAAKKTPGEVVPVEGGFVVRPQEPVNVQDVPQAPEVSQAAPAISQPGQAPQAVGAQPAGPAAGVPAEGAGAVEAAGLTENKVGRKDSAQIAQPESVVGDTSPPWASMTPDQRRRTRLEQEIATGMTNNGGVMAKLRPSAIEKRKQELAAMPPKEADGAAPNSGVDSANSGVETPAQETIHNGARLYPTKTKVGDEVKSMWAVESPDNQRRRAAGERAIGGDSLHDTIEQAKAAAEREAKRDAEQRAAKEEQDAADKARLDAEEARKAVNRPKTVVERRKDAILDGPSKIGPGTKRAVITSAVDNGYAIEAKMVYDSAAKKRDQEAVDRASRAGYILGVSNENLPLVKAGNEAKARLKEGKYEKPEYRVYQGSDTKGPFREITKTEYDYAQELKAQREAAQQAVESPALQAAMGAAGWTGETGQGDTIWTKHANGERYTALLSPDAGSMEVTVLVDAVDTQIASFKVGDAKAAAEAANKAVAQDVAEQSPADDFLPDGWDKSVNGYTKRPVYRMEQGGGQPFAVVTQVEGMQYEVQIRHGDKQLTVSKQTGALSEVLAKAEAELTRMTQADSVTHQDPGEKAEAATPGVVTDSLKKAARNEDTKPSEMRKWLVAEIDKELLQAADRPDYDEAVKRLGEKDAISGYTGNGPLGKNSETGYTTFDVPGDGKYKVRNSVRGLLEFRKNVMASQGFKDSGQKRVKPEQNDGVQGGSGGNMTAIANMIDEGDFEAARDYAEAVGIARLFVSRTPKNRDVLYAEQDGKLREVTSVSAEQKAQWERFMRDGTLPTPPDTKPQPAPKTAAQVDEEKRQAAEAEAKKPKDTGWNMAGTGYGGKRYIGRNITLDDGREVVARVYENAGTYEEAEVKVDGVRKFTVTDRDNAQGKADAFIRTLQDGDQAAESTKSPTRVTPQISGNPEKFIKVAADSVRELRKSDVDRVLTETPVQFQLEVARYIKDNRKDLVDEVDEVMADMRSGSSSNAVAPSTGARRDPTKVSMFNPYEAGDIVTIDGQDWTVKQDTPGWYLTNTGNWRGQHPTIRNVKAMADLISMVEQAATAKPAPNPQAEATKLTPAEAKSLMAWEDLGQKDGVKTHALTFYESQSDKDAKRGRMIVAKVSKGDRSATAWMVDGEDKTFGMLAQAKKLAEEVGMAKAVADGFVEQGAAAPKSTEKPAAPATTGAPISDFGQKIGGARKDVWSGFKDDLNKVDDGDIAGQPLAKVWPAPDYQKLIDAGMSAKTVAAVRALRDEVPAKPRAAWKVKRWAEQVKTLRGLANDVMDGKITVQDMERMGANKGTSLRGMMGRIELYELVGHAKSLEGVRFAEHHYTLYRGRENVSLWVVEKDAGASAFSNWPTEIAIGDTKEQALAAFQEKYASLDLQNAVRKAAFDIFSERGSNAFFVGKKIGRNYAKLEGPFPTVKEAREYREKNLQALEAKLEKYKEIPRERSDVNQPRVGVDMRNGQDVTPQMFGEVFGFRGVEFGNWVEQKRRQKDLNDAFDALMDMAAVLDIPPKAISLNGKLGLAFGARGSGGVNPAAAHYEPDSVVINLTKKEGAGSLGHEWWHALDNYFSKQRKVNRGSFMTTGTDVGLAARGKDYYYEGGVRQEMIDAFGAVVKAINQTAMKARSARLDGKRTKDYWATGEEMSARAFESYLISKLQDQNASNDYLANVVSEKTWDAMAALGMENENSYPYPTAAEIPAIRAGFDHFFQTVETKEDDAGNVAMFSRAPAGLPTEEALAMFNQATPPNPYPHKLQATLAAAKHGANAVQADNGGWLLAPKAQAYTAQELQDAQQRIDKLNRALKKHNNVTPAAVLSDAPTPAMAWGRSIARTLGYNVTFIQPNPDFHGVAVGGDAFVSASADHPEIGLIGHEVLHSFKQSSPDIYQALAERIRPYLKDGVVDAKRRWEDANGGRDTSMAHAEEEVLADLNGAMWLDPKFWREMAKNDQSLFRQVAYKFMEVATKAMQGLSRFKADSLVTDVDAVREIIAQEWAYQAQEMGNPSEFAASDSPAFSRTTDAAKVVGDTLKSITVANIKQRAGFKLKDYLGLGLQALGRRQIVDIYGDLLPLAEYNRLVQQMEADKNEGGAEADQLVTRWAKLGDEAKLADLMHEATLAQIDPDKPFADGDDKGKFLMLERKFKLLSDEAKAVYRDTRDAYKAHHAKVRSAIKERIERSELKGERKKALLEQMDGEFFKAVKGVYFPLARFGQYAVTIKGPDGKVESVSRAETKAEAEALRNNLLSAFPRDKGFTVGRVMLSKDFIADRDAVGRGFMTDLYQVLDKQDMDAVQRAELEDTLGQLYLSSLPDLSWAKHGIHRKGTPGFSQDARRAYAQNMFHGARYLAKLRYSDLMQDELAAMQRHVDDWREVEDFDQNSAQRVVDEMNKRHESLMNPKSNALSTALTSLGFVFHLGLSPASAMVNLSQTALVAYPIMGAKWGFGKASAALLKASAEAAKGKNDITGSLNADERAAYDEAVRAGTIDVTMAHDLAGIAQGEDAGVMWKIRPVMRWASFLFHHAERFNRQVTFVAAYRLAREAGADQKAAFEQATKATYDGHYDYSAANRPRIMQGNVAKVLLLFKQYGQNMVYTLARNAQQSIKGESPEVRAQARKALGGLLATHAAAAGVLGLPMVTTLLAAASMIGGDDDEPWDAKVALKNMLADTFGQKPAEVMAHGLSRLTPWDISSRVGLDRLIFPDVQEGLEGQRLGEAAMAAALGPVAGIGINVLKGLQDMADGQYQRGLESMMPAALRGPIKAVRYESEGVQDKTGVVVKDEVSAAGVVGQFLGFSPSEVRNAMDGKSAVYQQDRALGERRQELLTKAARATMAKDAEARAEAMTEIELFNQKNPTRRITPLNVLQSVRNRNKRIDQSEGGIYLPKNRRDAMDAGRFAVSE